MYNWNCGWGGKNSQFAILRKKRQNCEMRKPQKNANNDNGEKMNCEMYTWNCGEKSKNYYISQVRIVR